MFVQLRKATRVNINFYLHRGCHGYTDTSSLLFWTEIGSPLASGKTPFSFGNFVTADGYFQFLATMRMIVFAVEKVFLA